jgi:hypothetical protein
MERDTTDSSGGLTDTCSLYRARPDQGAFEQIAQIPDCNDCFSLAVSGDGRRLAAGCKTQHSIVGNGNVGTTPDVLLASDDGGRSWTRHVFPMFEQANYGYWNGRGQFDRFGNWYGLHLEILGKQGKYNVYRSYLVKRSRWTRRITFHEIPIGDNAGLYCKNIVFVSNQMYVSCGALKKDGSYSGLVLTTEKDRNRFETLFEYEGPGHENFAYLGLATDGRTLYSGIEESDADHAAALLGEVPLGR